MARLTEVNVCSFKQLPPLPDIVLGCVLGELARYVQKLGRLQTESAGLSEIFNPPNALPLSRIVAGSILRSPDISESIALLNRAC